LRDDVIFSFGLYFDCRRPLSILADLLRRDSCVMRNRMWFVSLALVCCNVNEWIGMGVKASERTRVADSTGSEVRVPCFSLWITVRIMVNSGLD
jgi:hypothetical protein